MPSHDAATINVRIRYRREWLLRVVVPIGQFLVFWFWVDPDTYTDFSMRVLGAEWKVDKSSEWKPLRR
jgi:hypothetical protein